MRLCPHHRTAQSAASEPQYRSCPPHFFNTQVAPRLFVWIRPVLQVLRGVDKPLAHARLHLAQSCVQLECVWSFWDHLRSQLQDILRHVAIAPSLQGRLQWSMKCQIQRLTDVRCFRGSSAGNLLPLSQEPQHDKKASMNGPQTIAEDAK